MTTIQCLKQCDTTLGPWVYLTGIVVRGKQCLAIHIAACRKAREMLMEKNGKKLSIVQDASPDYLACPVLTVNTILTSMHKMDHRYSAEESCPESPWWRILMYNDFLLADTMEDWAGKCGIAGFKNSGDGQQALFNDPRDLCQWQNGDIIVADAGNALLRRINQTGGGFSVFQVLNHCFRSDKPCH